MLKVGVDFVVASEDAGCRSEVANWRKYVWKERGVEDVEEKEKISSSLFLLLF